MNILILTSWYPNSFNINSGIFVKEQAQALIRSGLEPIIFYPYDKSISPDKLYFKEEDGIKVYRANTDYMKNTKLSRFNSILKSSNFIKEIVNKHNIELIHSHVCYPSGFAAAYYSYHFGMPFLITEHMSSITAYSSKFYNRVLFNFAYSRARKVICVSNYLCSQLKKSGYKFNSDIIGNVTDVDKFAINKDKKANRVKNKFDIVFIGGMSDPQIKGLQYFIPALGNFVKNNTQYSLSVSFYGDGNNRHNYEDLCSKYGIGDICKFYGNVPNEKIPEIMSKNDFLVLPSVKETFGCVLIESMAAGNPVLATSCGGPSEFIGKNQGILVEPGSANALEKGLEEIIKNYDNYDSSILRKYVVDNYSYESVAEKLIKLYSDIL